MELSEVVKHLNNYAPLKLSESWDNTGLLVEPFIKKPVSIILLTNDLTQSVIQEADETNSDLILSYHPPIFQPLKRINNKNWKERIVSHCLSKGIAIYSPHTCYDALKGGVNDWLISAFGKGYVSPLTAITEQKDYSHHVRATLQPNIISITKAIQILQSNLDGKSVKIVKENDTALSVYASESVLSSVVSSLMGIQEIDNYVVYKLEKTPIVNMGMGRLSELEKKITVREAVDKLKNHLGLKHIRLALRHQGTLDDEIGTVAVCAGAGSSVLRGTKANLYVTGELSHHEVLDFAQNGITTILTDHSNSERGFLSSWLKKDLEKLFSKKIEIKVSQQDKDPLEIV